MTYVNFSRTTIIVLATRDIHSLPSRCKPHSYMKMEIDVTRYAYHTQSDVRDLTRCSVQYASYYLRICWVQTGVAITMTHSDGRAKEANIKQY